MGNFFGDESMDWISLPRRTALFTAIGPLRVSRAMLFSAAARAAPLREMAARHALGIARAPALIATARSLPQQTPWPTEAPSR